MSDDTIKDALENADTLGHSEKDPAAEPPLPPPPGTGDPASTISVDDVGTGKTFRIGQYQVLREMGEGGMGTVYLGARADQEFKKKVAIKVIRKGMDSKEIVGRFRRERQILASLDHANIARLLDGGTTDDGLPYFVMEHIEGQTLTDYCDSHRLSTKERLHLFRTICSAVQYAHQNLVVHRDLKPANILVTADGTAKLLDFGIAKLLNPDVFGGDSPLTATDSWVMTPDYASPEQIKGEPITTSSDIYSLGVILYELLAGRRPYRITSLKHMEFYRVVCEQEPEKPSTAVTKKQEADTDQSSRLRASTPEKLQKDLRGDLDNIILLALRKEPQRRYASAEALSEDIRKHLEGHPVGARKGTWSYRAGKYVKRHKTGVAAAAVVLLLLVAFAIATAVQNVRIAEQRDLAEKQKAIAEAEAQKADKVTEFLVNLFEVNDPAEAKGETITAREILDKGAQRIRSELKDQPEVQAKLMNTLGVIYHRLGLYDQALPLLNDALRSRKEFYGAEHVSVAESLNTMGELLWFKGQLDEAEELDRKSLAMRRKLLGNEHPDVATSLNNLAVVLSGKGQLDEAEKLHREGLAMRRKLLGNEHPNVAQSLNDLALVLHDKGRLDEAEKLYREALAMYRKLLGNEHPQVATSLNNLALLLRDKGQLDEAEKLFREVLAMDRKLLGEDHPEVATNLNNLAFVLRDKGQLDEAEKLCRESLAMYRKLLGNEHPDVATSLNNLALVLRDKGQLDEAERLYRESLAMNRKLLGNDHPNVANSLSSLAEVLLSKGDMQAAVSLLDEALAIPIEKMPEDNRYRARAKSALGVCYLAERKYQQAEPLLLEAYKVLSVQEKGSPRAKLALKRIIDLYQAWGKPDKAEAFRKAAAAAEGGS